MINTKKSQGVREKCKFCSGKGWTLDYWATCPKCSGTGIDELANIKTEGEK